MKKIILLFCVILLFGCKNQTIEGLWAKKRPGELTENTFIIKIENNKWSTWYRLSEYINNDTPWDIRDLEITEKDSVIRIKNWSQKDSETGVMKNEEKDLKPFKYSIIKSDKLRIVYGASAVHIYYRITKADIEKSIEGQKNKMLQEKEDEKINGSCKGAKEYANTLDNRLPPCFKADNCEKLGDRTFLVHLTSHCGQDMVNDGRGSFGEREVRVGFDGKEYFVK
jgi:hypothetical protein